jgi:hypothetical protein
MAFGLYLELNPHRSKRDASTYPHMTSSRVQSPYATPRAEVTAYNSTIPPLPAVRPLSSAIESYIDWMSCQGIEVPRENYSMQAQFENRIPVAAVVRSSRTIPNGILRPPRSARLHTKSKQVRWRDHDKNPRPMGCFPSVCGAKPALVDVHDERFMDMSFIQAQSPPTMARNDPILSCREREMSKQQLLDYYGPAHPIRRSPSPHPVAAPRVQSGASGISIRRSPSPHPVKINQQSRQMAISRDSRGRSASPVPQLMPRVRSASPVPGGRPLSNPRGRHEQSPQKMLPPLDRGRIPLATGSFSGRSQTPPAHRGPQQQQRTSSHQWPPPQSQSNPQIVPSQRRGRAESRPEEMIPKRFAELPGREAKRYAELPGREESRKDGHFAEIVWKSKEKQIEDPREEKKRGWKLIRKSSSTRKQKPQPESPLKYQDEQDSDEEWITKANSSASEMYDRYNTTAVD